MIKFEDVSISYQNEDVLEHFNLTIEQGEFLTVIGSSGCGKTTMLKLINGLLLPQSGRVLIDDADTASLDLIALRRQIGYVIQEIGLFPHMNIRRNIAYVGHLERHPDQSFLDKRVEELSSLVALEPSMLERYPNELSGGQRQRVGIARALLMKPRILLMDEPFGAVDEITRQKLQDEILKIYREMSCTIVFVTHDIKEALKLGSRVLIMKDGQVIQNDIPTQILKDPATDFVSQLIGERKE